MIRTSAKVSEQVNINTF